jgi:hypothetical protein
MIASVPRTRELANSARNNGDKSRGEWLHRALSLSIGAAALFGALDSGGFFLFRIRYLK